jgi:hypothetical protein
MLVFHIWNVPDSDLGPETGYFKVAYGFPQSIEDNAKMCLKYTTATSLHVVMRSAIRPQP